jgi:hypothetical protein
MLFFEPKMLKNQGITASKDTLERGSAIVWILVMVALFAALTYAVSQGSRSGSSQLTEQQAQLAATEILDYARNIKNAVHQLQIDGCDETEVSFENPVVSGYTNPNSPTNKSCDVFNVNGGGLIYQAPGEDWLDNSFSSNSAYKKWGWGANYNIEGSGTTATDLRIVINFLKENICIAINDKLSILNPSDKPPIDTNSNVGSEFVGIYATTPANNIGDDGGHNLPGKQAFCRIGNTPNNYQFNQVLIAR